MITRKLTVAELKKRLMEESEKKKILLSATIEITSNCCFRCPHCYIVESNTGYMPLSSFEKIITELKALGCIYLTITGGEALIHPQFREIYLKAYRAGFIISLFSNGYFIDNVIDLLSEYKPYEVDITLYGIDDDSYFQNTGIAAGKKVFSNLDLLKKNNIVFSLKAAVTKKIYPYIDLMQDISKRYGVTFRTDVYIYLSKDQSEKVERLTPREIAATTLKNEKYVELERKALVKDTRGCDCYSCHPGETNIYITWDERAKTCPFASDEHSMEITGTGNSIQKAREYLQEIGSGKIDQDSKCYKCTYLSTCKRCPERFFIETGSYTEAPCWMCETAKLIFNAVQ